tara:strand:+ start:44946 stop:45599 length:654 start_codon:yes stop_codon:yes gene_type:complete
MPASLQRRGLGQKFSSETLEVVMNQKPQARVGVISKFLFALLLLGSFQASIAKEFVWAPDFPVGASIPEISAQDQDGNVQTFDDLVGERGMLFMMSRSFDWCPYCKAQLVQLAAISDLIEDMGISVVAMTYDSVKTLKAVQEDEGIHFPFLHDEDVTHVNAFGIRNTKYKPGDRTYGIPYPGIFLIDSNGVIKAKFAEKRYQDRPLLEDVLMAFSKL